MRSGLSHVCLKEIARHLRKRDFAFRRLECGFANFSFRSRSSCEELDGVSGRFKVESAGAPVSPRGSAPKLLPPRGRPIVAIRMAERQVSRLVRICKMRSIGPEVDSCCGFAPCAVRHGRDWQTKIIPKRRNTRNGDTRERHVNEDSAEITWQRLITWTGVAEVLEHHPYRSYASSILHIQPSVRKYGRFRYKKWHVHRPQCLSESWAPVLLLFMYKYKCLSSSLKLAIHFPHGTGRFNCAK